MTTDGAEGQRSEPGADDAPPQPPGLPPATQPIPTGPPVASGPPVPPPETGGAAPPPPPPPGVPGPGFAPEAGAPVEWAPPSASAGGIPVPGAPALRFARMLDRFFAWWLDNIIVGLIAGTIAGVVGATASRNEDTVAILTTIVYMGLGFLYFFGFWTSSNRATLGMRLFHLQVGNAFDGRVLDMGQAIRRWIGLGLPFQAMYLLPGAGSAISGLVGLWYLVLLISTAISPTRQGLHDRFAGSAVVQPAGAQSPAFACMVLLVLLVVVPLIALVALIFLGGQIYTLLSEVGTSIQP